MNLRQKPLAMLVAAALSLAATETLAQVSGQASSKSGGTVREAQQDAGQPSSKSSPTVQGSGAAKGQAPAKPAPVQPGQMARWEKVLAGIEQDAGKGKEQGWTEAQSGGILKSVREARVFQQKAKADGRITQQEVDGFEKRVNQLLGLDWDYELQGAARRIDAGTKSGDMTPIQARKLAMDMTRAATVVARVKGDGRISPTEEQQAEQYLRGLQDHVGKSLVRPKVAQVKVKKLEDDLDKQNKKLDKLQLKGVLTKKEADTQKEKNKKLAEDVKKTRVAGSGEVPQATFEQAQVEAEANKLQQDLLAAKKDIAQQEKDKKLPSSDAATLQQQVNALYLQYFNRPADVAQLQTMLTSAQMPASFSQTMSQISQQPQSAQVQQMAQQVTATLQKQQAAENVSAQLAAQALQSMSVAQAVEALKKAQLQSVLINLNVAVAAALAPVSPGAGTPASKGAAGTTSPDQLAKTKSDIAQALAQATTAGNANPAAKGAASPATPEQMALKLANAKKQIEDILKKQVPGAAGAKAAAEFKKQVED